jgi:anaerobic selenocysteine-containing dehydrogenase
MAAEVRVVRGGCPHDCPDTCSWLVSVEDGRATALKGDPDHPFTHGGLCAKVDRYLDRVYSPDRVLYPLKRRGPKGAGDFERVSWEEALAGIAARLKAIVIDHGGEAVLPYSFAGNMGLIQYRGMDRRFFGRLGASRLARTICGGTANAGVAAVMGTYTGIQPEQIAHARLILLWGANTIVTNLHLWPFIRQAKESGATVVVIDPIKTRTAAAADWHLQPLPGSDVALALGMMRVIIDEGHVDQEYVDAYTSGFDALRERALEYSPERVALLTGLDAEDVVRLARLYATTRPALIRTVVGPEKHANGGAIFRTIASLPLLTGAWRDLGGGLLHWTRDLFDNAFDHRAVTRADLEAKTRVINMIQLGRVLTDPDLKPPVKALFVYNSNPAVTTPNQNLTRAGLGREDLFTVVSDLFINDTARYADYLLPAASFIEQWDLLWPWGHAYVTLNRPAVAPRGEAVANTELFRRLAAAMGWDDPIFKETDEEMIRALLATRHPYAARVTYDALLERGWIRLAIPDDNRPFAAGGFPTGDGRARLDTAPLPAYESPPADPDHPLTMVSAKTALHFLNSSYGNSPRHVNAERRPVLSMNTIDAGTRRIENGSDVRVFNRFGSLVIPAAVDDRVRPGVVAMPHGWWGGISANALTSDGLADLGGGGDFYSTRVEVEPA